MLFSKKTTLNPVPLLGQQAGLKKVLISSCWSRGDKENLDRGPAGAVTLGGRGARPRRAPEAGTPGGAVPTALPGGGGDRWPHPTPGLGARALEGSPCAWSPARARPWRCLCLVSAGKKGRETPAVPGRARVPPGSPWERGPGRSLRASLLREIWDQGRRRRQMGEGCTGRRSPTIISGRYWEMYFSSGVRLPPGTVSPESGGAGAPSSQTSLRAPFPFPPGAELPGRPPSPSARLLRTGRLPLFGKQGAPPLGWPRPHPKVNFWGRLQFRQAAKLNSRTRKRFNKEGL